MHTLPLLCFEILSRDQRMADILDRVEEHFQWEWRRRRFRPRRRLAFVAHPGGELLHAVDKLALEGSAICVTLAEIFAELDELEAGS